MSNTNTSRTEASPSVSDNKKNLNQELIDLNDEFSKLKTHNENVASMPPRFVRKWKKGDKSIPKRESLGHKEDWHKPDERDICRTARYFYAKRQKQRSRARRSGFKPELGDEFDEEIEETPLYGNVSRMLSLVRDKSSKIILNLRRKLADAKEQPLAVKAKVAALLAEPPQRRDYVSLSTEVLLINIISYVGALAHADSPNEIMRLTLAVLGQHAGTLAKLDLRKLLEYFKPPPLEAQSGSYVEMIQNLRDGSCSLGNSPVSKFLCSAFTMMIAGGLNMPVENDNGIKTLIFRVVKEVLPQQRKSNLLEASLNVVEFVASAIDCVRSGGSVKEFMFTDSLYNEVVDLLAEGRDIPSGALHDKGDNHLVEFRLRLDKIIARLEKLLARERDVSKNGSLWAHYLLSLRKLEDDILTFERNQTHRMTPKAVILVGESQIGKTNLYEMVRNVICAADGFCPEPAEIANLAHDAKYDDVIKINTKVIQIDDIDSTNDKHTDPSETGIGKLIKIVNNVPVPTNQSVAERKDRVFFTPKAVIGSSNSYDLGILHSYKTPEAAFNRLEIVEVSLKPEYSLNGKLDKVKAVSGTQNGIPPVMHRARIITWRKDNLKPKNPRHNSIPGYVVDHGEWEDFDVYLAGLKERSKVHFQQQRFLKEANASARKNTMCSCGSWADSVWCKCIKEGPRERPQLEPEFGVWLVESGLEVLSLAVFQTIEMVFPPILVDLYLQMGYISLKCCGKEFASRFLRAFSRFDYSVQSIIIYVLFTSLISCLYGFKFALCVTSIVLVNICLYISIMCVCGHYCVEKIKDNCDNVIRSHVVGRVLEFPYAKAITCLAGFYAIRKLLLAGYSLFEMAPEGSLLPTSKEDIEERRREKSEWTKVNVRPIDYDHRARTMTFEQVREKVEKNSYKVIYSAGNTHKKTGHVLFICDTVAVMNKHVWKSFEDENPFLKFTRGLEGSEFESYVSHVWCDPVDDIALFLVPNKPSTCDIVHLLADGIQHGLGTLMRRLSTGMHEQEVYIEKGSIASEKYESLLPKVGYVYKLKQATEKGNCGSVLLARGHTITIAGLHCAGNGFIGAATFLTKRHFDNYRAWGVQQSISPEGEYLIPIFAQDDILETCPFNQEGIVCFPAIDDRHCVRHYDTIEGKVAVCGYSDRARIKGRSDTRYNFAKDDIEALGVEIVYGPPVMRADRDHAAALNDRMDCMQSIDPRLLEHACKDYLAPILNFIEKEDVFLHKPLDLYEVLNGVPGNRFIGSIDPSTSNGFGLHGKKSEALFIEYDLLTGARCITPRPLLQSRFNELLEKARRGERCNPLIQTALKDEAVKLENGVPKKNTRVFYVFPFADFAVTKALFAPVVDVLSCMPLISECMGGMNTNTHNWTEMFEFLREYGENCIEGDYSKWDVRLSGQMIRAGGSVLIAIAKKLGYSTQDIQAMISVISDLACKYIMFQGALVSVEGWMMSGTYITLVINSVCNSLLYRCAFFTPAFEGTGYVVQTTFRDFVHLVTMGDDSLATSRHESFSQITMANFCQMVGVKYTTGDKVVVTEAFKPLAEAEFCKRKFLYCEELGEFFAPLTMSSIHKTYYIYKRSIVSERQQLVDAMSSAMYELVRHGREVFTIERDRIRMIAKRFDMEQLIKNLDWSYDEWLLEFKDRYYSPGAISREPILFLPEGGEVAVAYETLPYKKLVTRWGNAKNPIWLFLFVFCFMFYQNDPPWIGLKQIRVSITQNKNNQRQIGNLSVNSQNPAWNAGLLSGSDGMESHAQTSDTSDSFFSRPIRAANFAWVPGTTLYYEFNPWRSFFEDPRVANRIAHFYNLRAQLHVQLLVNGNPFYYGRGIMSYIPLPDSDRVSVFRSDNPEDLVEASQRPHIYFNPTSCEGGELTLPFVFPKTHMSIPYRDWRKMGLITIKSMNVLKHANGGVDPISISVLVYASQVEINTPTSVLPLDLEPQSGEYGMVSGPSMRIANFSKLLTSIPTIAPFAIATEMIATGIGRMAMLFGYSRPRIQQESDVLVTGHAPLATAIGKYSGSTLAIDPKKEITIDPRVCGLSGQDDMAFGNIVTRETFIDTFDWSEADGSDRHLYSLRVNPMNGLIDQAGHFHITPVGVVAMPFEYWTGCFEVRFQVVCSAYHRGRLRIVWDPSYVASPDVYNVSYSALVDITESTELVFKVGWGQSVDYLRVPRLRDWLPTIPRSNAPSTRDGFSNGTLSVFVVNNLTSPSDELSTVDVNVFMKACDDFRVASPTSYNLSGLKIVRNAYRIPEDLDNTQTTLSARFMSSIVQLPMRVDELNNPTGTELTFGTNQFGLNTYSANNGRQSIPLVVSNSGPSVPITFEYQDRTVTRTLPGGSTTIQLDVDVEPGWNNVPVRYRVDSNEVDVQTIAPFIPDTNSVEFYPPSAIFPLLENGTLLTYNNNPTVSYASTSNATSTVLFLENAVAGTIASIAMTTPSIVEGSVQRIGDENFEPNAARVFSFTVPPDKRITIRKSNVQDPWSLEISSLVFIRDENFIPQGGFEPQAGDETTDVAPEATETTETMGNLSQPDNMNSVYFGEEIISFRTLLRRSIGKYYWDLPDGSTPAFYYFGMLPHFPKPIVDSHGLAPGAWDFTTIPSYFDVVSSCYVCMRGSTRVTIIPGKEVGFPVRWYFSRLASALRNAYEFSLFAESGPTFRGSRYRPARLDGTAVETTVLKPYPEVEFPWYSQYKFTSPRTPDDYRPSDWIAESQYLVEPLGVSANNWATVNYSTGEDFSLAFFLSTPELELT